MKNTQKRTATRASVIAVRAALAALALAPAAVYAAEADQELMQPTSRIEVGIGSVSDHSAAFGEYNGLYKNGAYFIGNFDLKGGGGDRSAFRWRATGTDLGLATRNLGVEAGEQGRYRFNFGYDQLKRDFSDNFQTIYNGTGTTTLTLPAAYPAAATRLNLTGTSVQVLSNWANLQSPYATAACATTGGTPTAACQGPGYLIPQLMKNPGDIATERKRSDAGFSYFITPGWEFKASVRREDKDGVKLTGYGVNGPGRGFMLPEPINSTTDHYDAGIAYVGRGGYMNFGYSGANYRNATNLWTAENPFWGATAASGALATAGAAMMGNTARLTGAPDNQMHQFNMSGGVHFSPKVKLVLAGSYGLSKQNEDYNVSYPAPAIIPVSSANAQIVNTSFLARLTTRPTTKLSLNAAYKYDNRDNQTPSHLYAVGGTDNPVVNCNATATICIPNVNHVFANEPLSRKTQKFTLDADYALGRDSSITGGYEWLSTHYYSHAEEVPVASESSKENTWRLDYRNSFSDNLSGRVGYSFAQRRIHDYREEPAAGGTLALPWTPVPVRAETGLISPLPAGVYWPAADPLLPGFKQFITADRDRDSFRSALNFRASDALTLDAKLDYNRDRFTDSQYGLKDIKNLALTLDGAFVASETLSFGAFYTYEDMSSHQDSLSILRGTVNNPDLVAAGYQTPSGGVLVPFTAGGTALIAANAATVCLGSTNPTGTPANYWTDPCRQWGMTQADRINTIGVNFRSKGLLGGKLELTGDLVYSRARTPISMSGGNYVSNGALMAYATADSFPDITSTMTDLRITGKYALDKRSAVRLSYMGRHLSSADFQYDAYASNPVAMQTFPGTGMTSPNYTVHVISAAYIYSFK